MNERSITARTNRRQTLRALADAWEKHPDQRLCQLIVNATNSNDPFYTEDADLRVYLRHYNIRPQSP